MFSLSEAFLFIPWLSRLLRLISSLGLNFFHASLGILSGVLHPSVSYDQLNATNHWRSIQTIKHDYELRLNVILCCCIFHSDRLQFPLELVCGILCGGLYTTQSLMQTAIGIGSPSNVVCILDLAKNEHLVNWVISSFILVSRTQCTKMNTIMYYHEWIVQQHTWKLLKN